MHRLQTSILVCGAALFGLGLAGCRDEAQPVNALPQAKARELEGFFDPQVDESWTYTVTRDLPPGTELSPEDAKRAIPLPGGALRLEFERRRVCTGTLRPAGFDRDLTTFEISEDGIPTEQEVYDISDAGVVGIGWAPAGQPLDEKSLLDSGLKIAVPNMTGGQSWVVTNKAQGREFQVEVIERSDLNVPVGIFDSARLRFTTTQGDRSTKRTIWFAENVGIVKEETVHYDADEIRVRESLELTSWLLPSQAGEERARSSAIPKETDPTTQTPPGHGPDPATAPSKAESQPGGRPTIQEFISDLIGDPYDDSLLIRPVSSGPPAGHGVSDADSGK